MQRIAVELDLDPIDVITRNLVPSDRFPTGRRRARCWIPAITQKRSRAASSGGGFAELQRAPRSRARRGPPLRHRLCGRCRAQRLQHGLHHDGSDAGRAAQSRAEERRAGDRHRGPRPCSDGVRACRLGAAGAGPSHRAVAQIVADVFGLTPADIRVNHRARYRQGRLVDRLRQLFQPVRGGGRRHRASRRQTVETKLARIAASQLNADADDIVFKNGRVQRPRQSRQRASFSRLAALSHWSPGLARGHRSDHPRDRVLDTAGTDAAGRRGPRSTPRSATASSSISAASKSIAPPLPTRIDRYVTMHDCGTHPASRQWSTDRSAADLRRPLGAALYEEYAYAAGRQLPDRHVCRLSAADHGEVPGSRHPSHGDAIAVHAARLEGRRRRQLHVDAGLHRQRGRRRARHEDDRTAAGSREAGRYRARRRTAAARQPSAAVAPSAGQGGRQLRGERPHDGGRAAPSRCGTMLLDPATLQAVIPGCHSVEKTLGHAFPRRCHASASVRSKAATGPTSSSPISIRRAR